jgi:hypothetical protein
MPPKTLEEHFNGQCKHYSGAGSHKTCRAGVDYAKLGDDSRPGMLNRLPCMRTHFHEDTVAECARREWHTPEELAERVEQSRKSRMRTVTTARLIALL